jgi:hypothetical protein
MKNCICYPAANAIFVTPLLSQDKSAFQIIYGTQTMQMNRIFADFYQCKSVSSALSVFHLYSNSYFFWLSNAHLLLVHPFFDDIVWIRKMFLPLPAKKIEVETR